MNSRWNKWKSSILCSSRQWKSKRHAGQSSQDNHNIKNSKQLIRNTSESTNHSTPELGTRRYLFRDRMLTDKYRTPNKYR